MNKKNPFILRNYFRVLFEKVETLHHLTVSSVRRVINLSVDWISLIVRVIPVSILRIRVRLRESHWVRI